MNDIKDRNATLFQGAMLVLNFVAVLLICIFISATTEKILANYDARDFLDGVVTIPESPMVNLYKCLAMMSVLVITFLIRQFYVDMQSKWIAATLILDLIISGILIFQLHFNYNGLLLLVFANVIFYVKDGKSKMLFVFLAIVGYLIADYELLSIYMPLYNISDYIQYYSFTVQQYLFSVYNVLVSLNIVIFIIYCVYVINVQRGTIEEVNRLYHELQTANEQLKEYANMAERMAQTKERNRLAREIHDTLGHTLTGIATGLDACLTLMDVAPEQTKKQLELLSKVSREGVKDVRRSVNELRPDSLERLSLEMAIREMVVEMSQVSDVAIFLKRTRNRLNSTRMRKMPFIV